MLNKLININYLIYGSSIVIGRGLEFIILFFAAYTMSKNQYGEFEYYKKIIETFSIAIAFGFPSLIISYTKSEKSKDYFYILSILFVFILGIISYVFTLFFDLNFIIIPIHFYAIFFTGSITQSYILVKNGPRNASIFKILISVIFYLTVFCCLYFYEANEMALIYASNIVFPLVLIYILYVLLKSKIEWCLLKKYFKLFQKLLYGSLTMVISDFANIMFLYTDIFIIKFLSNNANTDMANFSFALNIAAIMLIIPITILQVNIENLKKSPYVNTLKMDKQINVITILASVFLILFYKILIDYFYPSYKETFWIFTLIIIAKIFQSLSNLFGTNLLIQKRYNVNLKINIVALIINCILSISLFKLIGLYGIVISSIITLSSRYLILRILNFKYFKTNGA